jgi:coiled-coil domain-containing protein 174
MLQDDPIVEYEDEFGRMRTARRSEVPRNLQRPENNDPEPEDEYVLFCLSFS